MVTILVDGHRVRVCDYCKTVCIPSGRFCSGRCSRNYYEFLETQRRQAEKAKEETVDG